MSDMIEDLDQAKREYERVYNRLVPTEELFPGRTPEDSANHIEPRALEELHVARSRFLHLDEQVFTYISGQARGG